MKGHDVLLAIGGILLVLGLVTVPSAVLSHTQPLTWTIAPGANNFGRFEFDTLTGGSLYGTFVVTSGGTVRVYVLDAANHAAFLAGQPFTALDTASGPSGSFSATLPSGGAYFVEFAHGAGYESVAESGTGTATVDAVSTTPLVYAIILVAVGACVLAAGLWWRSKAPKPSMAPPPAYVPGQYYAYPPPYVPPQQPPAQQPPKPPSG